jgi:hypothetical protein
MGVNFGGKCWELGGKMGELFSLKEEFNTLETRNVQGGTNALDADSEKALCVVFMLKQCYKVKADLPVTPPFNSNQ